MMKKTLTLCALLLLPSLLGAQTLPSSSESVDWNIKAKWKIDAKPIDLVHSLDNKKVFILADDGNIHVFSAEGAKLGRIPIDKGVTAIDIEPRGNLVYLINGEDNTFTSLTVSFTTTIDVTGSPFLGNENAPVVLAVFSDFQ